MTYAIVGGCVAPEQLAPFLRTLQADSGCSYESIYRGEDQAAVALLHRLGKHTQAEIYQEYLDGQEPNPANPPGRSTHECRSDGVPYAGPVGRELEWWQCGIDVDDAHVPAIIAAAAKYGWKLFRPYPTGSEYHHVNFRVQPKSPVLDLRVGDTGRLISILSERLQIVGLMKGKSTVFGARVHGAVVKFQRQNRLMPDGVVGPKTWSLLKNKAQTVVKDRGKKK